MFWERCKRYVARLIDGLRYFVFPRRCAACGRLLSRAEEAVCVECLGKLIPFHYSESVQSAFFFPLTDKGYAIKCGFLFEKEGVCRNIIHHIKYYGSRETGIYFGHLLAHQLNYIGKIMISSYPSRFIRANCPHAAIIRRRRLRAEYPSKRAFRYCRTR